MASAVPWILGVAVRVACSPPPQAAVSNKRISPMSFMLIIDATLVWYRHSVVAYNVRDFTAWGLIVSCVVLRLPFRSLPIGGMFL